VNILLARQQVSEDKDFSCLWHSLSSLTHGLAQCGKFND